MYGDQLTPEVIKQLGIERQAFEQLIGQKVLAAEARRLGLATTDEELQKTILGIPAFKDSQGRFVGPQVYEQVVRSIRYPSVEDFENELSEQLLVDKLNQVLSANLYLSDAAVEAAYRKDVEKAAIRYVQLPAQDPRLTVEVSPDELKAYLEAHRDQFRLPEQRKVAAVTVDNAALRSQVQVADADVEAYYRDHPDEFTQEEQVRARHILLQVNDQRTAEAAKSEIEAIKRRIAGGEDFAAVAKEVSQDPGSAARGGDLGYFGRGRMTPEFENAAFDAQTGDLVGPVVTPFGVHLLAGPRPSPEGPPAARRGVEGPHPGQAPGRAVAAGRRGQGHRAGEAAQGGRRAHRRPPAGGRRRRSGGELPAAPAVRPRGPGARHRPRRRLRGHRLPARAPARCRRRSRCPAATPCCWSRRCCRRATPSSPRSRPGCARPSSTTSGSRRRWTGWPPPAPTSREGKKTLDQVAAELGQTVEESGEFGRGGAVGGLGFSPRIADAAMALSTGEIGGPLGSARGAVLFQVTERKSWDPAKFKTESAQTRDRLEREELNRLLGALIQQRRAELGVTYDRPLAEQFQKDQKAAGGATPS